MIFLEIIGFHLMPDFIIFIFDFQKLGYISPLILCSDLKYIVGATFFVLAHLNL